MIYLNTPQVTIRWNPSTHCVESEWKAYCFGEDYRQVLEKGLELLVEKKAQKVLVDSRNMKVLDPTDQQWTVQEWTPRAVAAGMRYNAMLLPTSAIARSSLNRTVNKINGVGVTFAFFDNAEEANTWLRSCK